MESGVKGKKMPFNLKQIGKVRDNQNMLTRVKNCNQWSVIKTIVSNQQIKSGQIVDISYTDLRLRGWSH